MSEPNRLDIEADEAPYGPVGVWEGLRWHMHAEPVCADPGCRTYLTPAQMAEMRAKGYSDATTHPATADKGEHAAGEEER